MNELNIKSICGKYYLSSDKEKINIEYVHHFLNTSTTWGKGMSLSLIQRAITNSYCVGLYLVDENLQIGFARIISDFATYANLQDVFIAKDYRKRGLGTWIVMTLVNQPNFSSIRRFTLATKDAHKFYKKIGFNLLSKPESFMEIYKPNIYIDKNIA